MFQWRGTSRNFQSHLSCHLWRIPLMTTQFSLQVAYGNGKRIRVMRLMTSWFLVEAPRNFQRHNFLIQSNVINCLIIFFYSANWYIKVKSDCTMHYVLNEDRMFLEPALWCFNDDSTVSYCMLVSKINRSFYSLRLREVMIFRNWNRTIWKRWAFFVPTVSSTG